METTVSGALGPDEMPMDLNGLGPDFMLVGAPGGCSLSSCPDSGTEDSDIEAGVSCRRFSRLLGDRMSTGGPLLARVQKHRTPAKTRSSEVGAEEAEGPCTTRPEEQGTSFEQNMAVMRDTIHEDIVPPSLQAVSRVGPLSVVPRAELQRFEVPFFHPTWPKSWRRFLLTFEERSMVMMMALLGR